jgi:hypothetical protein
LPNRLFCFGKIDGKEIGVLLKATKEQAIKVLLSKCKLLLNSDDLIEKNSTKLVLLYRKYNALLQMTMNLKLCFVSSF